MTSNDVFLTIITVSKSEAKDEQKKPTTKIFFAEKVPPFCE